MAAKKQKISYLLDAITQIKTLQSQDSGNNPILKQMYHEWLNKLFNKLYEEEKSQLKKRKKTIIAKSKESKNQGLARDKIGDLK
jgi:hypothetical protein